MSAAPTSPSAAAVSPFRGLLIAAMPAVFVALWSTGFIGAKFGLPYAGPMTFLALRFLIVAAVMLAVSLASGAAWPRSWREAGHATAVGLLIQFTYLGGVFFGIAHGVTAGVAALIAGLQPVLTAALAGGVLGERVTPRQWLGFALGLIGVAVVVWNKLAFDPRTLAGLAAVAAALLGITAGTLYQKRFCADLDLRSSTAIQNGAAAVAMVLCAIAFESLHVEWTGRFLFALGWLCIVLSIGATMLFLFLLRLGAAARTASLFYLVPPVTAFIAYFLFDEMLGVTAIIGLLITMTGVLLVNRR